MGSSSRPAGARARRHLPSGSVRVSRRSKAGEMLAVPSLDRSWMDSGYCLDASSQFDDHVGHAISHNVLIGSAVCCEYCPVGDPAVVVDALSGRMREG